MTLVDNYPQMEVTIIDLPSVIQRTTQIIAEHDYESRVNCIEADFLKDNLSIRADVVSFVRVLHDWDDKSVYRLCKSAWQVLTQNGVLLICEPLIDNHLGYIKPSEAVYSIMQSVLGGKRRTLKEYETLLFDLGFDDISFKEIGIYNNTLIIARKPFSA